MLVTEMKKREGREKKDVVQKGIVPKGIQTICNGMGHLLNE